MRSKRQAEDTAHSTRCEGSLLSYNAASSRPTHCCCLLMFRSWRALTSDLTEIDTSTPPLRECLDTGSVSRFAVGNLAWAVLLKVIDFRTCPRRFGYSEGSTTLRVPVTFILRIPAVAASKPQRSRSFTTTQRGWLLDYTSYVSCRS